MDAIVLVGGKGTRLRSVIADRPKPMAEVAGRPFLEWLLLILREQGVRRVILATGYMGDVVRAHFGDGHRWQMEVVYAHEEAPLGTAGALRNALPLVTTQQVLALNGDSLLPLDVARHLASHQQRRALCTLWLVHMDDCQRYGTVQVADDGLLLAFREKAATQGPGLINAGVYLCERALLDTLPAGQPASLEIDVFPALIGHTLYGAVGAGPFLDIGTPESYARAAAFLHATFPTLT